MLKHYKIPIKFTPQVSVSYSLPDTKTKRILPSLLRTRDRDEKRKNPLLQKPLPSKQFLVRLINKSLKDFNVTQIRQIPLRIMEVFALFVHGKFADKGNFEGVLQQIEEYIILQYLFDSQYLNKSSNSQQDLIELKLQPRLIPNIEEFERMAQEQEVIKHFNKIKLRVNKMLHVVQPDFLDHLFTFLQKKIDLSLCIELRSAKYFADLNPIMPKAKKVEKLQALGSIANSVKVESQKLIHLLEMMTQNDMKVPYLKIQGTIEDSYQSNFQKFLREAPNLIHAFNIAGLQFAKDSILNSSFLILKGSSFLQGLVNLNLSYINYSKTKIDVSQILQNTRNLELLDLSGCTFNREQFRSINQSFNSPWIQSLSVFIGNAITITTPKFEPEFAAFVKQLGEHASQLKELDLCDAKIQDPTADQIRQLVEKCEKMHAIDIRNNYISKRGLMDILLAAISSKNMFSYQAEGNKQKIQEGLFLDIPREIYQQINVMINRDKYPLLAAQKLQVKERVKMYLKRHTIT